jgi:hypothetical protein
MEKFKYGIMVIDPMKPLKNGSYEVVHFVGYWEKPTDEDANRLREELRIDSDIGLRDIADKVIMYPATEDCLKFYNDQAEVDGIFNEPNPN